MAEQKNTAPAVQPPAPGSGSLDKFVDKFNDWKFCPPAGHLWTVKINLHNDAPLGEKGNESADHSFKKLYENILKVNKEYHSTFSSSYAVSIKNDDTNALLLQYIESLQDNEIGLFLANEITFNSNNIKVQDTSSQQNQNFTGWLSYGKVVAGRDHSHNGKFNFYATNWDINELFFDRWIAAIGQQGLVEGDEDQGLYNIKADIFINLYSPSVPTPADENWKEWQLRKTIKLTRAFPKSRDQYKFSYNEDAAEMVSSKVDIEFENYSIEYEFADYASRSVIEEAAKKKAEQERLALNNNKSAAGGAQMNKANVAAKGMA